MTTKIPTISYLDYLELRPLPADYTGIITDLGGLLGWHPDVKNGTGYFLDGMPVPIRTFYVRTSKLGSVLYR